MPEAFLTLSRLHEILDRFPQTPVAVAGDFFLDEYLILDKSLSEISIETGLEAFQVNAARKSPGAAGTVTNILRALDVPVSAIGFCGDDGHGYELRRCLENLAVSLDNFAIFPERVTPTYTKPMLLDHGCETELSRMDTKNRQPLGASYEKQITAALQSIIPSVKAVLVVDQVQERNCGVVTDAVRDALRSLAGQHPETIFIADSREHMRLFENTLVKFNLQEAVKMLGLPQGAPSAEIALGISQQLFERYHMPIILTLGAEGMQVTHATVSARIPGIPLRGPLDIVGAGDSVMASMGASLSAGATLIEAGMIGVITASIIVQQIGTTGIATRAQIEARFQETGDWLNAAVQIAPRL